MQKTIIETKRLRLRKFVIADATTLQKNLSDKDVMKFSISGPLNIKETQIFLEKIIESYEKYGFGKLAIMHKDTNKLIGICGLHKVIIGENESKIELGYRLAKEFWGKGLATEAAYAVLDHRFTNLQLNEIISCVDEENISSIKVSKKIGMTFWKVCSFFGKQCQIYRITRNKWHENK